MRHLQSLLAIAYAVAIYAFIFLPVAVLVLFSFQDGTLPVPPLHGLTLRWYGQIFADQRLMIALWNSLLVAIVSSAVSCLLGFLAAYGFARLHAAGLGAAARADRGADDGEHADHRTGAPVALQQARHPPVAVDGRDRPCRHQHAALLCHHLRLHGRASADIERAARDLGASDLRVLTLVTAPMLAPSILAAFFLSVTFSWDEFIVAFLLSRFDVTLPVEIWSMLRSGLNPKTNAIGSVVFLISVAVLIVAELTVFRKSGKTS